MELREKAKSWLEKYKSGDPYAVKFGLEDVAAVVAEYLHESEEPSAKKKALEDRVELLHEDLVAAQGKVAELERHNKAMIDHINSMQREMDIMGGRISAYEFVIRCNGVSGAEVREH